MYIVDDGDHRVAFPAGSEKEAMIAYLLSIFDRDCNPINSLPPGENWNASEQIAVMNRENTSLDYFVYCEFSRDEKGVRPVYFWNDTY